jgi:flagellar assembly factor FliW
VIVKTGRFGQLTVSDEEIIEIPGGVLGFPEYKKFTLVDAADETLILWLQSLDNPEIAFPVLEPKVFRAEYSVRLSAAELRELKLENINKAAVFSILTIPSDVTQMTANLKAPIVINLAGRIAKQVVLQENEYSIKHPMFKELRAHLVTIQSQVRAEKAAQVSAVSVKALPASLSVKSLQA